MIGLLGAAAKHKSGERGGYAAAEPVLPLAALAAGWEPESSTRAVSQFFALPAALETVGNPQQHWPISASPTANRIAPDSFGARYYNSALGRFLTPDWSEEPDPIPYADLEDPQSLNLYSYAGNNPVTFTDADGHLYQGAGDSTTCPQSPCNQNVTVSAQPGPPHGDIIPKIRQVFDDYSIRLWLDSKAALAVLDEKAKAAAESAEDEYQRDEPVIMASPVGVVADGEAAVEGVAALSDANKLNHIFGNAQHGLDALVEAYGSREKAYAALQAATDAVAKSAALSGTFKTVVKLGDETVTVTGRIIDGVARIGTAYISKP